MGLTKRDMAIAISEKTGLTQGDVAKVIQMTLDAIASDLAQGKTVELRNFGVFEVRLRKSRKGRNPNAPQLEIPIPERVVVKFRAGKELKKSVEQLDATPFKAKA